MDENGTTLPREDKLSLDLLGAIAENQGATQRDLSSRLGIALGLTNALIKRLARKGYIKISNVSSRRVRYLLTPKGIAEKSRLTYSYIQFSVGYYRTVRSRVQGLFDRLSQDGARRIVFCGTGEVAEIASVCLHGMPLELVAVVDGDGAGQTFLGHSVLGMDDLPSLAFDAVVLTVAGPPDGLWDRLLETGVPRERIWGLDGEVRGEGTA